MALIPLNNYTDNAVLIPDYTVLEVYKDSINDNNSLGYHIMPLEGVDDIETAIRDLVEETKPTGYTNLAILAGHNGSSYNRSVVYCVWYQGTAPTYPADPVIPDLPEPAAEYNVWQNYTVTNPGLPTNAIITLLVNNGECEFYINQDHFTVNVSNNVNNNVIKISKDGVFLNDEPYDKFTLTNIPTLINGDNIIKINKANIVNFKIDYTAQY